MSQRSRLTAALLLGALSACSSAEPEQSTPHRSSLLAAEGETSPIPGGAFNAPQRFRFDTAQALNVNQEEVNAAYGLGAVNPELEGLSTEFPWLSSEGGIWQGSNTPDPGPLQKIPDAEMLATAAKIRDGSVDRQHALVSIGRRKVPGAVDALASALALDEILQVREMGLSGLIEHGGADALALMWQVFNDDPSPQMRGMAVWAIALYGASEASKAVHAGLDDKSVEVKGMALLAVWALKDHRQEALSILAEASKSENVRIYQESAYMLSRMPYAGAGTLLVKAARAAKQEIKRISFAMAYKRWRQEHPDLRAF